MITRALSIRQPWADRILREGKDVENRPRRFHYRGPVFLHAGANLYADLTEQEAKLAAALPRGGIIGAADIVDCVTASTSKWFFGPFGLVLANVRACQFVPCLGRLGIFHLSDHIAAEANRALRRATVEA